MIPINSRFIGNEYRIDPSGDGAVDTPAFSTLVDAIGTGRAKIKIADNGQPLVLDGAVDPDVQCMGNVDIEGETRHSRIRTRNAFNLNWGGYAVIPNMGSTMPSFIVRGTCNATTAGDPKITGVSGVTLAKDDTVFVWCEDATPDVEPHQSGWTTSPGEIHRVERVSGGDIILASPIIDTMTTSVKVAKITTLNNCSLRNLTIESDLDRSGTGLQTQAIDIFRTRDFILEDVVFPENGPGYIRVNCHLNCRIFGLNIYGQPSDADDYGVVFGAGMGGEVANCSMQNTRHPFTTGAFQVGTHRYGTPAFAHIHHNWFVLGGDGTNSWVGYDCHSEGYGLRFEDNIAEISNPGKRTIAFFSRARQTQFIRNVVRGANDYWTLGFKPVGGRCVIKDNYCEGVEFGVYIDPGNLGNSFHDHVVSGNTFVNNFSSGVLVVGNSNNLRIHDNKFRTVAKSDSSYGAQTIRRACITLTNGTGHHVRNNFMDKTTSWNNYSIDTGTLTSSNIKMHGNYCLGYGSGKIGCRGETGDALGTTAGGLDMASAFASKNYTD